MMNSKLKLPTSGPFVKKHKKAQQIRSSVGHRRIPWQHWYSYTSAQCVEIMITKLLSLNPEQSDKLNHPLINNWFIVDLVASGDCCSINQFKTRICDDWTKRLPTKLNIRLKWSKVLREQKCEQIQIESNIKYLKKKT